MRAFLLIGLFLMFVACVLGAALAPKAGEGVATGLSQSAKQIEANTYVAQDAPLPEVDDQHIVVLEPLSEENYRVLAESYKPAKQPHPVAENPNQPSDHAELTHGPIVWQINLRCDDPKNILRWMKRGDRRKALLCLMDDGKIGIKIDQWQIDWSQLCFNVTMFIAELSNGQPMTLQQAMDYLRRAGYQ